MMISTRRGMTLTSVENFPPKTMISIRMLLARMILMRLEDGRVGRLKRPLPMMILAILKLRPTLKMRGGLPPRVVAV